MITAITEAELRDILGVDDEDPLPTEVEDGKRVILVCAGMWYETSTPGMWDFIEDPDT